MTGKQLKNSILQWAIQGKLVPQDPNDEPASVLLERIRAEKARLVKEKKIKKPKNESIIFRGDDSLLPGGTFCSANSHYEKMADGTVRCIDDEIPFEIPQSWQWCRIKDISNSYIGLTYKPSDVKSIGLIVLRSSNIKDGRLTLDDIVRVNVSISDKLLVGVNDIIICARNGSKRLVGKSAIIREITEPMTFGAFMAICKTPFYEYVYQFLQSDVFFAQLREVSGTTTINQLTQNNFNSFLIPLPPLSEQLRIVEKLNTLLPLLDKYSKEELQLTNLNISIKQLLKKSILQEAIQGKLVPQCSEDEPASILLQRIKAEKERLIKEKKIKRDKQESVIFRGDDNRYYEQTGKTTTQIDADFPTSWAVVRLGSICQLLDGEKREGKGICMDAKFLRGKSDGVILGKGRFVEQGENIILVDGENSGEVFAVPHDGYMGSTFKQLWVSREMHLPYVLFFLLFHKATLRNSKKGAAIPHLNRELFNNLVIGVPPIEEQKRIAERIITLFEYLK